MSIEKQLYSSESNGSTHRLRARIVFPVDGPPIENGVIEMTDGRITALHDRSDFQATDLGNVAVVPGLINAHTHLEFSDLPLPITPSNPFTDWIRQVVQSRRQRNCSVEEIVQSGFAESVRHGTTTIGEIATYDDELSTVWNNGGPVTIFRELIGFSSDQLEPQMEIARQHLQRTAGTATHKNITHGLSPHAPYTVHPELLRQTIQLATEQNAPIAMHLAETTAELEFLATGGGLFADLLREFGVWKSGTVPLGTRPLDLLQQLADAPHSLIVHGNYLRDDELQFIAEHEQFSLIVCPRTHAYFGHPPHPWPQVVAQNGTVAVGTDSRASNPDLSIWRELQFLRQQHPADSETQLLQLGTLNGAVALRQNDELGSLTCGKIANLAVVELTNRSNKPRPDLFDVRHRITAVMIAGHFVSPENSLT